MGYIKGSTKLLLCQIIQGKVRNLYRNDINARLLLSKGISMHTTNSWR